MNKHIILLSVCLLNMFLASSQKTSVFGVRNYKPLSPNEVQFYLKELSEMEDQLTRKGSKKGRKHRKFSSKRGGKKSRRKSKGDGEPWRAGMYWWDKKHSGSSSSSSWSSKSYNCNQKMDYGKTECTNVSKRFYFERESNMCREFFYTGCGGNKNNFRSKNECLRKCKNK